MLHAGLGLSRKRLDVCLLVRLEPRVVGGNRLAPSRYSREPREQAVTSLTARRSAGRRKCNYSLYGLLHTWYHHSMAHTRGGRGLSVRQRRQARERAIVAGARGLFDGRARRDASVDEIARAAGINKALVYRAFDCKEEIFVLTLTDYLAELKALALKRRVTVNDLIVEAIENHLALNGRRTAA